MQKEKKREEISKGKQQIIESNRRLLRLKAKSDADVTSVSVSGDDRENQRRIADEQRRQELRSKLLSEAESSARQNAAVAMRWADLFSIEVSQNASVIIFLAHHAVINRHTAVREEGMLW
jgi:dynein regulatory complex protein 1